MKCMLKLHLITVAAVLLSPGHDIGALPLARRIRTRAPLRPRNSAIIFRRVRHPLLDCLEKHEGELSRPCKDYEERLYGPKEEKRERARQYAAVRRTCKRGHGEILQRCRCRSGRGINVFNE